MEEREKSVGRGVGDEGEGRRGEVEEERGSVRRKREGDEERWKMGEWEGGREGE